MSSINLVLPATFLAALVFSLSLSAATITVAKSGADFSTINAAIKAANPGDVIKITDLTTYEEQVTFDSSKYSLMLTSNNPTSLSKPVIKYQDKINVGPKTSAESLVDSLITFDHNGALRILGARNIIIDGIAIDGGGVYPFGYPSIWSGRYGLQHGNAAIALFQSGSVIIRNCDISNAYFGISVKDRNTGGIYYFLSPSDYDTNVYVPFSKFGQTGNHLVERNRIHNNSWGMFFESCWDLGSTIRYNLMYENHHANDSIATVVKNLTSDEGANQPGGAFLFKDNLLSPLAVYNNTFYHNFALLAGHWQAGYQHLVFNNIFGPPFKYLQNSLPQFSTAVMEIIPVLTNRLCNCVFSAQARAPQQNTVNILDSMPPLTGTGDILSEPGTIIAASAGQRGFPASSANRWLEMDSSKFLSVNPASTNFLEPNWANEDVKQFIIQQGWEKSGVKNSDGTRADLGAIEQAHGVPSFEATIQPGPLPIIYNGTNAQITFSLDQREKTTLVDPRIKLCRLVKMPYRTQSFGINDNIMIIPASNMIDLAVPTTPPVNVGPNMYSFTANITNDFAFIEMIIEATGADGKLYTTPAEFLPYRKLSYLFKVEIFDKTGTTALAETHIGDSVMLKISPQKIAGEALSNHMNIIRISLQSGYALLSPGTALQPVQFPNGITGPVETPVMFSKIPENGYECISVAGIWRDTGYSSPQPVFGGVLVKVLPLSAAIWANKHGLALNATACQSNEMTISCFDLQGRRIFQKTIFSDMSLTDMVPYLPKKIPGMASKVYLMDISVKDRISPKQTRSVGKLVAR